MKAVNTKVIINLGDSKIEFKFKFRYVVENCFDK